MINVGPAHHEGLCLYFVEKCVQNDHSLYWLTDDWHIAGVGVVPVLCTGENPLERLAYKWLQNFTVKKGGLPYLLQYV